VARMPSGSGEDAGPVGPRPGAGVPRTPAPPGLGPARKQPRAKRCPTCEQAFSGEARFCPFDGDALVDAPDWNPSADPLLGTVIEGRYEVTSVIGEGGMGTVYEVRHTSLGRRFALKVLRRDLADAEHTARFIQEAKAAAAIGHPNIVAVSDFGELTIPEAGGRASRPGAAFTMGETPKPPAQPVPYFVMEYLTGISLASLLRAEKTLDPVRAADIVLQCAAGLSAAHAAGVIHRDLKPDNVFLTRSGEREFVKLLDFGVAKMAGAGRLTRAGMVFGTPHYMSPEQAAGQGVDHRADVYALGVILYESLAGKVPFEADTYMGVLTKHMFATPEPIDRMVPDASALGTLGPIVMRCLAKNPHDRYASMAELVSAIEGALAEAGVPRPGAMRSERPRSRGRGRADSDEPVTTPGLRPVVGPIGYGLGALALALVLLLGIRELRGGGHDAATAPAGPDGAPTGTALPPRVVVTAEPASPPPPAPSTTSASTASATTATTSSRPAGPAKPPTRATSEPSGSLGPRTGRGTSKGPGSDVRDPWK
jgi:eukaryotic-like serine/threonine-protein kinase